jgi:hypothetical protein
VFRAQSVAIGAAVWLRQAAASHPGYVSGRWYNLHEGLLGVTAAPGVNQLRLIPFMMTERVPLQALGAHLATQGVGAFHLGIYGSDQFRLPTGTPVAQVLNLNIGAAVGGVSGALSQTRWIDPGLYFSGVITNSASGTFKTTGNTTFTFSQQVGAPTLAQASTAATNEVQHLVVDAAFSAGGMPNVTGATFLFNGAGSGAVIYGQVA